MNEKQEFLSTISHEIRTPLTSIKGFSKTILDSYDDLNDEQKKKFIKIIYEQSQRLISLVENVLTAANSSGETDNLILKKTDVNLVLQKSVQLTSMNWKNKEYKENLQKNLYSVADPDKLQQIFVNLLDNASKYSGTENVIEIKTCLKDKKLQISIKNYGAFISEEETKKIFDKFYRTETYLTSKTQGSGLGLYIVKVLLEKMNGTINVKSENSPKPFVDFIVTLPVYTLEDFTKNIKEAKNV